MTQNDGSHGHNEVESVYKPRYSTNAKPDTSRNAARRIVVMRSAVLLGVGSFVILALAIGYGVHLLTASEAKPRNVAEACCAKGPEWSFGW
jgi:hypothetical protein